MDSKTPSCPRGLNAQALQRVTEYVEGNLAEDLALGQLADVACMSRFHFARMFRRSMGQSPMAYVSHRRVERALLLLAMGDDSLATIAANVGFCDQSHLIRKFRKVIGLTPASFRTR
jgi:AraC family transcriptional regulator